MREKKSYCFKEKLIENSINKYKLNTIIKAHKDWINSIQIFPLGNIISVSNDRTIKIFDINFKILQNIKNAHDDYITYVDIKDENNFITCSWDQKIKIWIKNKSKFKLNYTINAHNGWINKVMYYLKGNIISCSTDNTVKIWEENNNKYQLKTTIYFFDWISTILLLKDKNILITCGYDGTKLWNINNFEIIKTFITINCSYRNALKRIDEDKIIIGGYKLLKIISLLEKKEIKTVNIPFTCLGIEIIKEKELLFIGGGSNDILIYSNYNYECIQIITNAHDDNIDGFIKLKNGSIVSYSNDGKIKVWL